MDEEIRLEYEEDFDSKEYDIDDFDSKEYDIDDFDSEEYDSDDIDLYEPMHSVGVYWKDFYTDEEWAEMFPNKEYIE